MLLFLLLFYLLEYTDISAQSLFTTKFGKKYEESLIKDNIVQNAP